nr:ABC transporter permease [Streptomyces sp. NBC_00886]
MISAIAARAVRAVLTVWMVVTAVFVIIRLTGDPIRSLLPENTPAPIVAEYRHRWGLDKSMVEQYWTYLGGVTHGDFGVSYFDSQGALHDVLGKIPATLDIALPAFVIAAVSGTAAGILAAVNRGGRADRVVTMGAVAFASFPPFLIGVVLMLVFGVELKWLPTAGSGSTASLILPIVTLVLASTPPIARIARASMSTALNLPCIAHAQALHVSRRRQIVAHALPQAALPLMTVLGFQLSYLIAGSTVIEVLFSWPGVGRLFVQAANQHDFSVVQCVVLLVTVSVVVVNALTDLAYQAADPRLRRA